MKPLCTLGLIILLIVLAGCGEQSPPPKTQDQAAKLLKDAEKGDAEAQLELGRRYANGEGVPKDATKAVEWYQKAASQGNVTAQLVLGQMYHEGIGVPKDAAKALDWNQKAAAQGNADAQVFLGWMYGEGEGVPKDSAKAFEWYQKAAAQGNAEAQYSLGRAYALGEGVPKNAAKAVEWLEKAAVQGNADAQVGVGIIYAQGEGVPKDLGKAFGWFEKAAAQGNAAGQVGLGFMYADGHGVPKDSTKAFEWFQKAAAQGNAIAQFEVGRSYAEGDGVPKDSAKAAEWYQKAAAQGNVQAQAALVPMYMVGDGVAKDLVLAYAWFNLSAVQRGQEPKGLRDTTKRFRDTVERLLTRAERAEGQRLASNWKPGTVLARESASAIGGRSKSSEGTAGAPIQRGTGTGFLIGPSGHILTNLHVVDGCTELRISGRDGVAKVLVTDRANDLALLQIPGEPKDFATLTPEPSRLRQGEDIVVYGYPLNAVLSSGGNLSPGVVSAMTGLGNNTNQIQITAPIQPGSSGSPVLNKKGHVVGIVSMKLSELKTAMAAGSLPQNVSFAVNAQTLRSFLDAHKVPYRTGSSFFAREKSTADLAEEARKWTVVVECWK